MKVLLFDSSGSPYGNGLARELNKKVDFYYVTRKGISDKSWMKKNIYYYFYDKQVKNRFNRIIKGLMYVLAYVKTMRIIKKEKIDVLHIQWLNAPLIDSFFLKKIRKKNINIVLTAHNVLPHVEGEKYIEKYKKLYSYFNKIIVHGEAIKTEFSNYFPNYLNKVVVLHHGLYFGLSKEINLNLVNKNWLELIKRSDKTIIFFGIMFYNKGIDIVVKQWLEKYSNTNNVLVIAGILNSEYKELISLEDDIKKTKNIIYYPYEMKEEMLNAFVSLSDIIIMPYRHASMSGIVFKAVEFEKTVLTTDVGAIKEYLDRDNSFVCNIDEYNEYLDYILNYVSRDELQKKGKQLSMYVKNNYSWDVISNQTIIKAYNEIDNQ